MDTTKRADQIAAWDVVIIDRGYGLAAYTVSDVECDPKSREVTIYLSTRSGAVPLTVPDFTQIRVKD